jgi:phage terminase large subunit-like protein
VKKDTLDPVTRYATDVVDGKAVASRLVCLACERHLADLEQQTEKGLEWRPEAAQEAVDFFAEVLMLPDTNDEQDVPKAFVLQNFQQFIAGSLFGWYTVAGRRRFRTAYIETGKGSGKTCFGAGLMLYMLVADGERGAQIFAAAVGKDQAKLAFTDAERMVDASPWLKQLIDAKVNNLAVLETGSFFRPVSSEKRGLDGKRVHGALIDELHEHPTSIVVNKMRAGTKNRENALIVEITNSGYDRQSICWQHHDYSRQVLNGTVKNEGWFAFVCGLDPCQACVDAGKWFPDEKCEQCDDWKTEGPHWLKANPNLGISLPWQYVRDRVQQALGMPGDVSDVLRFNFCVWTQGVSRAIDMGRWGSCAPLPSASELLGAPCFGALDLGESDDFSAWVRIWLLDDGRVAAKWRFWVPEIALDRYPGRPYEPWRRSGALTVTEGDITDYRLMRDQIIADCQADGVREIAFDPRSATETSIELEAVGITMIKTLQGEVLDEAIKRMLELIVAGTLCHGDDPIATWMASNLVLRQGRMGRKRIDKERAPEKIDGMAALATAIDWAVVRNPHGSGELRATVI